MAPAKFNHNAQSKVTVSKVTAYMGQKLDLSVSLLIAVHHKKAYAQIDIRGSKFHLFESVRRLWIFALNPYCGSMYSSSYAALMAWLVDKWFLISVAFIKKKNKVSFG